jgi:hypothetical protein
VIDRIRVGVFMLVSRWPKNRCLADSKAERAGLRLLVQRAGRSGDVGGLHRRVEIVMNDGESAGIGVVDTGLLRRQRVLDQLVFHAVEGERAGGVEAERAQVARQHLHRRDTAGFDRFDKFGPGREREILAAPEAETLSISEIVDGGGAGRRDVGDAGVRERVLETKPGAALLRGGDIATFTLATSSILHRVRLVENHRSIEIGAQPFNDLLDAR